MGTRSGRGPARRGHLCCCRDCAQYVGTVVMDPDAEVQTAVLSFVVGILAIGAGAVELLLGSHCDPEGGGEPSDHLGLARRAAAPKFDADEPGLEMAELRLGQSSALTAAAERSLEQQRYV